MLIDSQALMVEPLLTAAEEVRLAQRVETGVLAREARLTRRRGVSATDEELAALEEIGEQARQRYIRANLRLVAKLARQLGARTGLAESDLFQEGCLGLICAVERFDYRRGYRFSTYASFWIRAYLSAASASLFGALNVPTSRANQLRHARGLEVELAQSLGHTPSLAEVAATLGRTKRWTADLLAHQAPQSLDALGEAGMNITHAAERDGPGQDQPGAELLEHLDSLEREVVARRYGFPDGIPHSYAQIGTALGISVSRVRRIEHRGLEVLRSVCPQSAVAYLS
ncbi:MAG TPA: sigma-70 family RNA polymerase sigma factor [Propionibacteriaceae bacterium]|jgi:RNA polymerase sigma factor (sigma-70 family)